MTVNSLVARMGTDQDSLAALGVHPETVGQVTDSHTLSFREFESRAADLLPSVASVVETEIVPRLHQIGGHWHPTGFMVFPLGSHPRLGTVRLHVWPRGLRQREVKGRGKLPLIHDGDIHDHAWHVGSIVLRTYRDILFDVASIEERGGALPADCFRVFTVEYGAGAHNALTTDGSCIRTAVQRRRTIPRGQNHFIRAGEYHAPVIPDHELAATVVFSSPRVLPDGPRVLIGGGLTPILGNRVSVSPDAAMMARSQLSELAEKPARRAA